MDSEIHNLKNWGLFIIYSYICDTTLVLLVTYGIRYSVTIGGVSKLDSNTNKNAKWKWNSVRNNYLDPTVQSDITQGWQCFFFIPPSIQTE